MLESISVVTSHDQILPPDEELEGQRLALEAAHAVCPRLSRVSFNTRVPWTIDILGRWTATAIITFISGGRRVPLAPWDYLETGGSQIISPVHMHGIQAHEFP